MKLIKFECDQYKIQAHQAKLSDIIRQAMYNEDEKLFSVLDFTSDQIFLEPSLFCRFLSDFDTAKKICLLQSVWGYSVAEKRPSEIKCNSDLFGLVNLPNIGYFKMHPFQELELTVGQIKHSIKKNSFIDNSLIRLCLHPTDQLALKADIIFDETVEQTLNKSKTALTDACLFLQSNLPDFWQLIESVTREFVLFSSPNQNSFAGISHHGTAYFNTENKIQTCVFFIDDISHQCGHIIFNALTLDVENYLRVPKNYPIAEFVKNRNDKRNVYGAFHGLFTYTCVLYSLDKLLDSNKKGIYNDEAIGRLGFYMNKFGIDLVNMNNSKILTENGMGFLKQFQESYNYIFEKYQKQIRSFDYSNQPYTFQHDLFKKINSFSKSADA